jgi:hypothetical protein
MSPTLHPVYPIPEIVSQSADGAEFVVNVAKKGDPPRHISCTREELVARMQEREVVIRKALDDPLRYGYEPQHWRDADALLEETDHTLCVFGGNRAGKSTWGLKRAVQLLVEAERPVDVLLLQNNELSSNQLHQKVVHSFLPMEWRNLNRKSGGNIRFDPKTGFSDSIFTTPRGGTCIFGNYGQDLEKYEGLQFDMIVPDENMPLKWYLGLLRCLSDRSGKMPWLFTPIDGMTPAINEVAGGARTIRSLPVDPDLLDPTIRHVDDCPVGEMPYTAKAGSVRIIYFHSVLNPFGNFANLKSLYGNKSREVRERRFYGFARKAARVAFPQFCDAHILPHADMVARMAAVPVSRYHIMDPAGSRNMFMLWLAVTADNQHFVYREWPDEVRHGEWAVPSEDARKWDGAPGPAQPSLGMTITDYKRMILFEEGNKFSSASGWEMTGEVLTGRVIDPRSGNAESIADRDGGSSIINRFEEEMIDPNGIVIGPTMIFDSAPGLPEARGIDGDTEGVQGINDLLGFNSEEPIVKFINEPKLFVSDQCTNLIWALKNYTGNDGGKAACKDPIDCLRYAVTSRLEHLDEELLMGRAGGRY